MLRYIFLLIIIFIANGLSAQSGMHYEGDAFTYFLGKDALSESLKDLKADYHCEMVNENHYLSNGGLELILQNNTLNEINLYKSSAVYGTFTSKLPKNLKFGMTSAEAKKLLGKPYVSYHSGYCEYNFADYILSAWFDGGRLSQIGISVKPTN